VDQSYITCFVCVCVSGRGGGGGFRSLQFPGLCLSSGVKGSISEMGACMK
jgi:hypothetical protein